MPFLPCSRSHFRICWKAATLIVVGFLVVQPGIGALIEADAQGSIAAPPPPGLYPEEIPYPQPLGDPIEPFNRGVGYINHGLMMGVIDPTAKVYRFIIPKPVRTCVNNAGRNLAFPVRGVNNLLQGQFSEAGEETERFLVNTTVGILGLFDPATKWGIGSYKEDTGLTFGKWGWENQMYLMLPFFGPSSERDTLGKIGDTLLNPATYLYYASSFFTYNRLSDDIIPYKRLTSTEYDPYALSRDLYAVARMEKIEVPPSPAMDDSATQTLGAVLLDPKDPNFPLHRKKRKVAVPSTNAHLPYSLWLQPEPAPVAYILPGLGGHRESSSTCALAEMAFNAGYSVVAISSSMNWEFINNGLTAPVPGYPPSDARDIVECLDAVHRDLLARHAGQITGRILMGVSLGAFHTLVIADSEARGQLNTIHFDRYIALNPPVDLLHGIEQLDRFYNAPLKWPEADREARMYAAMQKAVGLLEETPGDNPHPTFSGIEARFLIGLLYRMSLRDTIHASQRRYDMGVLRSEIGFFNREENYLEIMQYGYQEYYQAFVIPALRIREKGEVTTERIQRASDLRVREPGLKGNQKVCVFANENDFLLREGDLAWLQGLLPETNLRVSPRGGHMGNLHEPEIQTEIYELLRRD